MRVELLQPHRFHQGLASVVVLLLGLKLRQGRFDRCAIYHLLALRLVSGIQVSQVLSDPLIQLLVLTLELIQVQMASRRSNCLKLAPVDGNQVTGNQTGSSAKLHKGPARRNESDFVVLSEVSDGL
ncbi:hypothetical protein WCE02_18790 [Pseudomonas juntendi]|uniref:hypothetical protein n=1 Tax=Pseudomonas TaxID=286 RepID=UPI0034D686E3